MVIMGGLYHGKIILHWCDTCHTPVLGDRCSCGSQARPVPLTPPGDPRPAFPDDIAFINQLYEETFGMTLIPEGRLALLNKVPDKDRMEEIVLGGAVVGAIRYREDLHRWEALPRPEAAGIVKPTRRYIIIDDGAEGSIREGSSLLAPGLVHCEESVRTGDEVFMVTRSGSCAGVGRARVDAEEANRMERGQVVKTRKNLPSTCDPGPSTWDYAVRANRDPLDRAEAAVRQFIAEKIGPYEHLPMSVSYSGGKDSLATFLVVKNAYKQLPILFIDTGLEFPSTHENVNDIIATYGVDGITIQTGDEFWKEFEIRGPPAVDDRWCCKVAKLEPLRRYIEENIGEIVSFVGQRKYESFSRMKNPRVWRNAYVQNQVCLAPIHNWTALHVWLYIFRENAPFNDMYRHGVDRMGCYMCPACDLGVLERIQGACPDLWSGWADRMEKWRIDHDLPEDWSSSGSWRKKKVANE